MRLSENAPGVQGRLWCSFRCGYQNRSNMFRFSGQHDGGIFDGVLLDLTGFWCVGRGVSAGGDALRGYPAFAGLCRIYAVNRAFMRSVGVCFRGWNNIFVNRLRLIIRLRLIRPFLCPASPASPAFTGVSCSFPVLLWVCPACPAFSRPSVRPSFRQSLIAVSSPPLPFSFSPLAVDFPSFLLSFLFPAGGRRSFFRLMPLGVFPALLLSVLFPFIHSIYQEIFQFFQPFNKPIIL